MNSRTQPSAATDLLAEAAQWHLLSLLLSRPTAERKDEVSRLGDEIALPRLRQAARGWLENAAEGAYLQLLGPGGLVPARAVAYRPFADPGWMLAEIARGHDAFGFHASEEEPPDHMAVIADFVAYLLLKEAYARERGADGDAAVTRGVMTYFIEEYLVPMASRVADRLEECGATQWATAARLIADEIPAPPPATVAAEAEEDTVSTCGGCAVR